MRRAWAWTWHSVAKARRVGSAAGFVLIDVLVSLVITSLVLVVLFEVASQNLAVSERAADRYRAAVLARSKLASLGITEALSEGQSEGRFDAVFSWSLTVGKDETLARGQESASITLYSVRLDVRWQRRSKKFRLSYKTLRVAPQKEVSAPATRGVGLSRTGRAG